MTAELPPGYRMHTWTDEEVARFWDFVSQAQPSAYFSHQVGRNVVWNFRRQVRGAKKVLDYGCGSGRFLEELIECGCVGFGYDSSPVSREQTTQRLKGRSGFGGVIAANDSEHRGSFDLAFCIEVVEHLYDDQLRDVLDHIRSFLVDDGRVIVTTPNDEDLSASWIWSPGSDSVIHRWQHVRSWTGQTLAARLESAGFVVESIEECNAEALGRGIRPLGMRLAFALTRRRPNNLFIVARRSSSDVP